MRLPPDASGTPRPLSVKRVTGPDPHDPTRWWIDSDNAAEGVTSFDIGPVPESSIVGVVMTRLPRALAHRLGR